MRFDLNDALYGHFDFSHLSASEIDFKIFAVKLFAPIKYSNSIRGSYTN